MTGNKSPRLSLVFFHKQLVHQLGLVGAVTNHHCPNRIILHCATTGLKVIDDIVKHGFDEFFVTVNCFSVNTTLFHFEFF